MYRINRERLLEDLYYAYYDARKHKRNKSYQLRFEANLDKNLNELCDALWNRTYKAYHSDCFIIKEPKCREVFAANFRDRVVHHLYYNYTHKMFERTFIKDTYSCIKGRGTHFGIERLRKHILSESRNYSRKCYVLKMDIRGYFMNINRQKLLEITANSLNKMATHKVGKYNKTFWEDVVDMDLVNYITKCIVTLNPIEGCHFIGPPSDWDNLPFEKSMFHSPADCGLPIGNLTSQLYSNVYLNVFDQFMKREMHCRHYGRYVDDFYVVSTDKEWLESLIPKVRDFLKERLGLTLHEGKTRIIDVRIGVEFLGAFVLPYRIYINRDTLMRMDRKLFALESGGDWEHIANSLNSYCGILSHWQNYNTRKEMLLHCHDFTSYGMFDYEVRHFYGIKPFKINILAK